MDGFATFFCMLVIQSNLRCWNGKWVQIAHTQQVNWSKQLRRPAHCDVSHSSRATITMRKRKCEGFPGCQSFSQEDFTSIGCCWCMLLLQQGTPPLSSITSKACTLYVPTYICTRWLIRNYLIHWHQVCWGGPRSCFWGRKKYLTSETYKTL